MFIWHLERKGDTDYGELLAVVVVADDEAEARRYAAEQSRDEGTAVWHGSGVIVRRVGVADAGIERGVLCADTWEA
ncbi:MAG: hypothetical protein ACRDTZ_11045 [Pseudonocardiaceae bacterium]